MPHLKRGVPSPLAKLAHLFSFAIVKSYSLTECICTVKTCRGNHPDTPE